MDRTYQSLSDEPLVAGAVTGAAAGVCCGARTSFETGGEKLTLLANVFHAEV